MTKEEKRDKIIHALQMALDKKREGTLQALITWLKAITPLEIKDLVINQEQAFADRDRADGVISTTNADKSEALITELQETL